MPLKITLKPNEKIILGGAVITNGKSKNDLTIENRVPLLRQKDIITEKTANTPARRIYFVTQLMYVDQENLKKYHDTYWKLVRDFLSAAPSALMLMDKINEKILCGNYYQALKQINDLMDYEQEIIKNA
jgi:flagellar biosynthesis repressor protein FlbT